MTLEIIAHNLVDIEKINNSQATRIEFCVNLAKGGITPPLDLIEKGVKLAKKDLMLMLRVETANFYLDAQKLTVLLNIIKKTKHLPFKGYVFGALNQQDEIDLSSLAKICQTLPKDKELTFHKAFDQVRDPFQELKKLEKFPQIKRVLTSGPFNYDLMTNLSLLKKLSQSSKLELLIGGGVNKDNIASLVTHGFTNIHCGSAVRIKHKFENEIEIKKIDQFQTIMQNISPK